MTGTSYHLGHENGFSRGAASSVAFTPKRASSCLAKMGKGWPNMGPWNLRQTEFNSRDLWHGVPGVEEAWHLTSWYWRSLFDLRKCWSHNPSQKSAQESTKASQLLHICWVGCSPCCNPIPSALYWCGHAPDCAWIQARDWIALVRLYMLVGYATSSPSYQPKFESELVFIYVVWH